ncbi:MAG: dephospho-CoA kinase, partial [Ignavibacteriaceae bacterium]
RLQRSIAANKFTEEEFKLRESNQIPQEVKIKHADFIFSNNGSEKDLFKKAEFLLSTLKKL